MATFQIPQFINQKARILGPLTILQFGYIVFGCILSFIAYSIFTFTAWVVATIIIGIITLAFTFVKINGQPLSSMIRHIISYFWNNHVYTWQRIAKQEIIDTSSIERIEKIRKSLEVKNRLKSLESKLMNKRNSPQAGSEAHQVVTYLTGEKKIAKRMDYK